MAALLEIFLLHTNPHESQGAASNFFYRSNMLPSFWDCSYFIQELHLPGLTVLNWDPAYSYGYQILHVYAKTSKRLKDSGSSQSSTEPSHP